ncbi:MAG: hypothetical protein CVT99_13535 [Bacteroidetes bacterium HGW-Bacteroidetes-16]|jgi:hypothetical protein|nr:MAG: hypothetical protein CVT99_13535 [Bacteroidetes bacterium HGW-Bacteroidetes-16]
MNNNLFAIIMKKKILLLLATISICVSISAQNDLKARMEYDEAEKAFNENNSEEAISHLDKAQEYLGKWSALISYLKILSLDNLCDYNDCEYSYNKLQQSEVKQYLDFSDKNEEIVNIDKFKNVYEIEQKLKEMEDNASYLSMPELINSADAFNAKDYSKANDWLHKAADKGNSQAMYIIGLLYYNGEGVDQDYNVAFIWSKKAADKGVAGAMNTIGACYANGYGVPVNTTEAINWYKKAAKKGEEKALANLGYCYKNGTGLPKNVSESIIWFTKACEKGNSDACFQIGFLYHDGVEVKQDFQEARNWYNKSIRIDNNLNALKNLGWMYENGQGEQQNISKASDCYKKATEKNDSRSMYLLGKIYTEWIFNGVHEADEAIKYLTMAADRGEIDAMELLVNIYSQGWSNVKKDRHMAKEWTTRIQAAKAKQ